MFALGQLALYWTFLSMPGARWVRLPLAYRLLHVDPSHNAPKIDYHDDQASGECLNESIMRHPTAFKTGLGSYQAVACPVSSLLFCPTAVQSSHMPSFEIRTWRTGHLFMLLLLTCSTIPLQASCAPFLGWRAAHAAPDTHESRMSQTELATNFPERLFHPCSSVSHLDSQATFRFPLLGSQISETQNTTYLDLGRGPGLSADAWSWHPIPHACRGWVDMHTEYPTFL
jgi:hypothetical protein